jgi:hypothetical protein
MTHDYQRHGTTMLFAALNEIEGTVIERNMQRHRHQDFIRFLNAIEEVPAGKAMHVILDTYAAHKYSNVRRRLDRHRRFIQLHANIVFVAQRRRKLLRKTNGDGGAGSSSRLSTCQRLSIASSSNTILGRSPSLGPLILTKSSELSDTGPRC